MTDDNLLSPIVAALQSGKPADAERLCRARIGGAPDQPDLLLLLGIALQQQGRADDAVPMYRRLTELNPSDSTHWCNYATALRLAGDLAAAEQAALAAVRLTPDEPERLEQLGLLQLQNRKLADARTTLLRAWSRAQDSASVAIHAASACAACRDPRASQLLQPWRDWLPLGDDLQLELANALTQAGEIRDAIWLLEDLLGRSPSHAVAQLLLARNCERVNRLDEAAAILQRLAATGPGSDQGNQREILRQRAQLAMRHRDHATALALLKQAGERDGHDYEHHFALAGVYDKLGDCAAAVAAAAIAHQRQVEEIRGYSDELLQHDVSSLPHTEDRLGAEAFRRWPRLKGPGAMQSPVFVVGFPRSGTTLLEQMLDAHPRLQSMDERPFFNMLADRLDDAGMQIPDGLERLSQRDCDELRKGYLLLACGKVARDWDARLVDKNPLNLLWLPMLHRLFPEAKIILALRHPCDVVLSCYMQNFLAAPLAVAARSLQSLARAYVSAMQCWLYHVALIRPDILVSRYEDLVADPVGGTRRIAAFLDIDHAESMLRFDDRAREKGFIATPSYSQVIEPISTGSVGHWRRYREYFEPVVPILRSMLAHWGYATEPAVANEPDRPRHA